MYLLEIMKVACLLSSDCSTVVSTTKGIVVAVYFLPSEPLGGPVCKNQVVESAKNCNFEELMSQAVLQY